LRKKILEGIEMKGTKRRTLLEKNGKSDDWNMKKPRSFNSFNYLITPKS
jgi:hypothetical protein